jgi:hypothetical protein
MGDSAVTDQVAAAIGGEEEESTLVEAILIVDTYDRQALTSVTEASAQSSTLVVPSQQQSVAAELLFASNEDFPSAETDVAAAAEDLDAVFENSNGLVNLGVVMRERSRERYAAARYLRGEDFEAESDDDNAFELAFAEAAEWRQF